jgi:hypothetical protein
LIFFEIIRNGKAAENRPCKRWYFVLTFLGAAFAEVASTYFMSNEQTPPTGGVDNQPHHTGGSAYSMEKHP